MSLQELLKELHPLEFTELIDLYIEAKLGRYVDMDSLLSSEDTINILSLGESLDAAIQEAKNN